MQYDIDERCGTGVPQQHGKRDGLANADFQKVEKGIQRFMERKNRKEVSLVESVLRAERETDKAIADEEKKQTGEDEEEKKTKEIFPKNFYNDELLSVALDYVAGLKRETTVKK